MVYLYLNEEIFKNIIKMDKLYLQIWWFMNLGTFQWELQYN